jgi:fido (protein-threonine AMPylation protein)
MARPRISTRQRLARALNELHEVLGTDRGVVRGPQISNETRVLLLKMGYLREILKGWYFVSDPVVDAGDTTPFYANFWEYLARYLSERFGAGYCLTAEQSILRHAQHNVIPRTVNVMLAVNQSQVQDLAFGHTVALYPGKGRFPEPVHQFMLQGLRCMSAPYCLVNLPPRYFAVYGREVQIVMAQLNDPGALAVLADVNRAGLARLLSGYRQVGRTDFVDAVLSQLKGLNIQIRTDDCPFHAETVYPLGRPGRSPLYSRIHMLWAQHRKAVLTCQPSTAIITDSPEEYLAHVQAVRMEDAYHSLSIERYRVTPELIRKIAEEGWDPLGNEDDMKQVAAMAAKGYLDAFDLVKEDVVQAYTSRETDAPLSSRLFSERHQAWYQRLFNPSVNAGILERTDLVGYRRHMVFLQGSLHSPPHYDYVLDGMEALCECFSQEPDAFVRAVLGHWLFGFIHPYMDGNGRIARFTMNLMLASGGYPWTVIRVEDRNRYMGALESASVSDDIMPFAEFVSGCLAGVQNR